MAPRGPDSEASAHDRILASVTRLAGSDGYAQLTVERVLRAAAVSRGTFYQYFSSIEDCFRCAYRDHAERLVRDIESAGNGEDGAARELAVLDALIAAATARPDVARVLMREGLAAGRAGLSDRDALVAGVERAMHGSTEVRSRVDLPPGLAVGATFRLLSMRLSEGGGLDGVRDAVREWAGTFVTHSSRPSWSERFAPPAPPQASPPATQRTALRPGGTARERIMRALAVCIREQGFAAVAVADIVEVAGVPRRRFYNEFASKTDAFVAAYEHGFQRSLEACAPAFFSSRAWPERVWDSAHAFTGYLSREPLIAYLGFVECYAAGPGFAPRVHDTQLAFTLFLEEGYRQRDGATAPSRACSTLTAAAIAEAGFQAMRRGPNPPIRQTQPLAVFLALTPFIGVEATGGFVAGKLAAGAQADSHAQGV